MNLRKVPWAGVVAIVGKERNSPGLGCFMFCQGTETEAEVWLFQFQFWLAGSLYVVGAGVGRKPGILTHNDRPYLAIIAKFHQFVFRFASA